MHCEVRWLKSVHANLYMQNTVHGSPSSCALKRKERNKKYIKVCFFRFATFYLPFFLLLCFFIWKHLSFLEIKDFFSFCFSFFFGKQSFEWRNSLVILIKLEQQFHYLRSSEDYSHFFFKSSLCLMKFLDCNKAMTCFLSFTTRNPSWTLSKPRNLFFCVTKPLFTSAPYDGISDVSQTRVFEFPLFQLWCITCDLILWSLSSLFGWKAKIENGTLLVIGTIKKKNNTFLHI